MAQKTNKITRATLIDDIKNIDPNIKGLTNKRKDELLRIYENLIGNPDTECQKLIKENEILKKKLKEEREEINYWRATSYNKLQEICDLREEIRILKQKPNATPLKKAKDQLVNVVELIDDLAKDDHLNTEASRQLNNELMKTFNLLTNRI